MGAVNIQLILKRSGIIENMRILVVEDEHKIANSIKKGLEQERYSVDVAYDGDQGYDLSVSEPYNVIILDIMLPGMDGLEIVKRLREEKIHTPVLMLTAKFQIEDRVFGLDSGADDYLAKPFAFTELLARVRALSRRPKTFTESTLVYKDLELDTRKFKVKRNGHDIELSKKEFALLEYLLCHPETILTKDQLIQNVWDYDAEVLPNTVEVYIGYLRQKVDKPFSELTPLIQTVRGFGYRLGEK